MKPVRAPHYPRCAHKAYHITCEQHELLIARSHMRCEICQKPARHGVFGLMLDHDHALGWRAIRGLLCPGCNARIGLVDRGRRSTTPDLAAYLASPWHASVGITSYACPSDCRSSSHRRSTKWTPNPAKQALASRPGKGAHLRKTST